jgi:hypothetical protein
MKYRGFPVLGLVALLFVATSCSHHPSASVATSTDPQIAAGVQAKLHAESALAGQNIQVSVNNGMVTLSGSAADPASRALAGNEAGSVPGVRTVVNNLIVAQSATASPADSAAPGTASGNSNQGTHSRPAPPRNPRPRHEEEARNIPPPPPPQNTVPQPAPAPVPAPVSAPPPPTPPPAPDLPSTVTVPAGTPIRVRIVEDLTSATATPDMGFHATLAEDLVIGNMIAIPQGTNILGRVVDAKNAAHFHGSSLLSIELIRIDLHSDHVPIVTDTYEKQGAGRGKNSAEKVGGGAVLGTLIGALAGGGRGAAIGAVAGAGAGGAVQGATRGQQVEIPSETLVNFSLQSPITVTTSRLVGTPAPPNQQQDTPTLQQRPPR